MDQNYSREEEGFTRRFLHPDGPLSKLLGSMRNCLVSTRSTCLGRSSNFGLMSGWKITYVNLVLILRCRVLSCFFLSNPCDVHSEPLIVLVALCISSSPTRSGRLNTTHCARNRLSDPDAMSIFRKILGFRYKLR
jgi:hypothetical protein